MQYTCKDEAHMTGQDSSQEEEARPEEGGGGARGASVSACMRYKITRTHCTGGILKQQDMSCTRDMQCCYGFNKGDCLKFVPV
eukprot:1156224-Pelagomonas_calceolata.AAC.1